MKINVFIPHRWNNEDHAELLSLLDRTKFDIFDYSVLKTNPFDHIDYRYNVDPQIKKQIQYASVVVCSNRQANANGMALAEIKYALSIDKPVVAIQTTQSTGAYINALGVPVIPRRKDSVENWITENKK